MESEVQNVKTHRDRPAGVSLIAIWLMLGLLIIVVVIKPLISGTQPFSLDVNDIINILIGVLSLPLAWGLWTLKHWAVRETIGLEIIIILCRVVETLVFPDERSSNYIVALIGSVFINLWIIYYLATSKKVREAFRVG